MSPHDKSNHIKQGQFEDQQFAQWLDKTMSSEQAAEFENNPTHEPSMKQHIATAKYVEYLASQETTRPVPHWDRGAAMEDDTERAHSWWQWRGLPVLSMAFSCFAMALVLFNVQLSFSDQGMLLTFGTTSADQEALDQQVDERVGLLVDAKLNEYKQQQELALANFTNVLSEKQQQSNLQLASYILETSRQERKEDISDFIQFVNAQRNDDALDQRIRFQQLEDAVLQQANFINQSATMQPANWAN
ncbi:hypothetical protein DXX93_15770 [Thalassotalea euphylliae]|uniref:Uncharacterized protein n=1 Tax=Thalassotalea euphylliae TaxID=1655234 RepID=A0A3E0TTR9_9GAMM|nr:hypothetical protein [Thalassotalea euphylliae]REL27869.1 hypothetical protein DXX93_15770 [Thalassotalea euphylliae]